MLRTVFITSKKICSPLAFFFFFLFFFFSLSLFFWSEMTPARQASLVGRLWVADVHATDRETCSKRSGRTAASARDRAW